MLGLSLPLLSGQPAVTLRKPIVLVGQNTTDLASGDLLDAVACLGYQPARPSLVAQTTASNQNGIGVGSGSVSNLASLAFTAPAPNVRVDAKATFVATTSGGAETVYAYVALYDTTGGGQNQVGTGVSRTINVYYGNGGRDGQPTYVYSGLTPGRQYTAYFYAFQADNSCAVNVSAIEMAISNT